MQYVLQKSNLISFILIRGPLRKSLLLKDTLSHIALSSLLNLKHSLTMVKPKELFLFLAVGLVLAPTGESLLIGHHRVLKSPDFYNPDPVRNSV